jgi:hypothetical protein
MESGVEQTPVDIRSINTANWIYSMIEYIYQNVLEIL